MSRKAEIDALVAQRNAEVRAIFAQGLSDQAARKTAQRDQMKADFDRLFDPIDLAELQVSFDPSTETEGRAQMVYGGRTYAIISRGGGGYLVSGLPSTGGPMYAGAPALQTLLEAVATLHIRLEAEAGR